VIVLDSSALLAMLFFEPGCERVAELVPQSCMSTVNLTEVLGRLARDGRALGQVMGQLDQMGIAWIDFDRELAVGAAALLRPTALWPVAWRPRLPRACGTTRSSGRDRRSRLGEARSRHPGRGRPLTTRPATCCGPADPTT
jgi:hypothetical protein